MPGQGRLGDKAQISADAHGCPSCPHPGLGPAISGSTDVLVNGLPALRVDDVGIHAACCGPNQWTAAAGAANVYINGKKAFRVNDASRHCGGSGKLVEGSSDVIVGDGGGGGGGSGGGRAGGGGGNGASGGGAAASGATASAGAPPAAAPAAASSPLAEPPKVTLHGVFKTGDEVVPQARFILRRYSPQSPPLTPATLDGQTDNAHRDDRWIADGNGEYLFREMSNHRYFVEVDSVVDGAAPPLAEPADDACDDGGHAGVIWARLVDDRARHALAGADYRIELDDDTVLTGTTDDGGELRHDGVPPGMYAVTVGDAGGTVPARPAARSRAAYAVRMRGAAVT